MERITIDNRAMSLDRQEGRGSGAQVELALERSTNILSIVAEGKVEYMGTLTITGKSIVVLPVTCGDSLL